jgi:hypothetical protein
VRLSWPQSRCSTKIFQGRNRERTNANRSRDKGEPKAKKKKTTLKSTQDLSQQPPPLMARGRLIRGVTRALFGEDDKEEQED